MTARVVVLGGGASGVAAAYAAHETGAEVTLVLGRPGATSFFSGALDGPPGGALGKELPLVTSLLSALGVWEMNAERCWVGTRSGLVRDAEGRDRSVLDLGALSNGVVGVIDVEKHGWDALYLARAFSDEPWARARSLRFEAVSVQILLHAHETTSPDVDLAALHDDPARVSWLVERLRQAPGLTDKRAIMTGPWLGTLPGVAGRIALALGKPIGEPLSPPGGVAGLRFERARDDLVRKMGIQTVQAWAASVAHADGVVRVQFASGQSVTADTAVLAVGGLVAGGLVFSPSTRFALSFDAPAVVAMRGAPLVASGSPQGAPFEAFAWSGHEARAGIERVGIWTSEEGQVRSLDGAAHPAIYAAGDAVADAPRTMIEALRSGVLAGRAAALAAGAVSSA